MNFHRFIGRVLAVLVIVGLVVAPLATPVAAKPFAAAEMSDMSGMSADMPCCPDQQKSNDCQDCPLIAMCMLTIAQAEPPAANSVPARLLSRHLFVALVDAFAEGLDGPPPDHPPRALV
jgi:hypothetical protein